MKLVILTCIRQIFEYKSHSIQMCTRISVIASNIDNKEVKVRAKLFFFVYTMREGGIGFIFLVIHKFRRRWQ